MQPLQLIGRLTILPRWVIICIDLFVISMSTSLAYSFRFNFSLVGLRNYEPVWGILITMICALVSTLVTRSYAGIVRYTGLDDGVRILSSNFITAALVSLVNLLYYYNAGKNLVPYSVIGITLFVSFGLLFFYRLLVKSLFYQYKTELNKKVNILIFGAGRQGIATKQVLDMDPKSQYKVIGFLEDSQSKIGKKINGTQIYDGKNDLAKVIKQYDVKELVIAVARNLPVQRKNEIVDICLEHQVKVRTVPPAEKWVKGELSIKQIREINIDDLLERELIYLDDDSVHEEFYGKKICITGAAGSIGSELVRQVLKYKPDSLILIDQAESQLYELERELKFQNAGCQLLFFLADITNQERMRLILEDVKPEIMFHAAAYKHVPMMESNPEEAVNCNILGTRLLANLAVEVGVKKFIMISTDKAVNPTNIMGCSKRIAEIYVQSLNSHLELLGREHTLFVTTRFGNVLGSNGSVIPLFKKQIESGGPITVTHPEITRYFMTIPEASRLVMEAGAMGQGGEIYVFDMGRPVKIADLAKRMIMLSGLELGKDIDIVFNGLRDGEKLYEELLSDKENTIATHHEKILKAKVREYSYSEINNLIDLLQELMVDKNELKMVALMKELVPEYKSNYSRFEVLDRD
jgi:FlaA1/EpsC-like NDP-sugar epimerase